MKAKARLAGIVLAGYAVLGGPGAGTRAEGPEDSPGSILRDGFEATRPSWREEETDATFVLRAHDRAEGTVHEGQRAERFDFEAGPGSALYYSYQLPKTPIVESLKATLYVRGNRPGVQIYGRVVLPADRDPESGQPTFLLVPGTSLDAADRWQRLELSDLPRAVERQAKVLRLGTGRTVSVEGAYLERLVINLYGGAGDGEVFLDDLTVSPVPEARIVAGAPAVPPANLPDPALPGAPTGKTRVQLNSTVLSRDGIDWVPRIIHAPGGEIEQLRRAGFDVMAMGAGADPNEVDAAIRAGYLLMPTLAEPEGVATDSAATLASTFKNREAVALWDLGSHLGALTDPEARQAELDRVRKIIRGIKELPEGTSRLTTGSVDGLFPQYGLFGRNLDLIGVEVPGFAAMMDPVDTLTYLDQRRSQTATRNPNALYLGWVPASSPRVVRTAVWGDDVPPAWGWPQIQPEQIRMYSYAAISAGYRALGYRGDADLSRPAGLPRLYELTLLVAEMDLIESFVARSGASIGHWPAFPPDLKPKITYDASGNAGGFGSIGKVKATTKETAALPGIKVACLEGPDTRSKLLIVSDYTAGSQWQPGKKAVQDLNLLVPVPESAQAFEISLGGVTLLESRREAGGRRITIPAFNSTCIILVTTDLSFRDELERRVNAVRPRAIDIAIKQAELQFQEAQSLHALILGAGGLPIRDAESLLASARNLIQSARDASDRQEYTLAWNEARTVGQALRMLMRAHWERAYKDYVTSTVTGVGADTSEGPRPSQAISPVGCPPLLTMQTLPHYYRAWRGPIRGESGSYGRNRVQGGEFEADPVAMRDLGWVNESYRPDRVATSITIDRRDGWGPNKAALKLDVRPQDKPDPEAFKRPDGSFDNAAYTKALLATADALPPFLDQPAAAVRSPAVKVKGTSLLRISVRVKMPRELPPGSGGLIIRDSLGGAQLQYRATRAIPDWQEVVLYRRAPADAEVTVLLGLAGFGRVLFDDLQIQVLNDTGASPSSEPAAALEPGVETRSR